MINIQDIIPFLEKGWVAMDECGSWFWYKTKPKISGDFWMSSNTLLSDVPEKIGKPVFDIAPADDWTKSLISVGGK